MAFGVSLCVRPLSCKVEGDQGKGLSWGQIAALATDVALAALLITTCTLTLLSLGGYSIAPLNALSTAGKCALLAVAGNTAFLLVAWDQIALAYTLRKAVKKINPTFE